MENKNNSISYIATANMVSDIKNNRKEEEELNKLLNKLRKLNALVCSINEY